MKIVAYADESGTHDKTGSRVGAKEAVVGGFVAWRSDWAKFSETWQAVLTKYDAPYFHFNEWAAASAVVRKKRQHFTDFNKNPYKNWDLPCLDSFLNELAQIAGAGNKILIGGYVDTHKFSKAKSEGDKLVPSHGDPYKYCLTQFFDSFRTDVQLQWPMWSDPVSFVFDQTDDPVWRKAIIDVFASFQQRDSRFYAVTFADKKAELPLQAADMVAYRMRQITGKYTKREVPTSPGMPELDKRLFSGPFKFLEQNPGFAISEFLNAMRE